MPFLLDHLKIKHVALICHSAGGIYFLNTLYHLPHILFPGHAYAAAFGNVLHTTTRSWQLMLTRSAPWVHPAHSSVSLMRIASSLPTSLISKFDRLQGWVINSANPVINTSSGLVAPFVKPFKSGVSPDSAAKDARKDEVYGVPAAFRLRFNELLFKWAFLEDTKGATEDAILCLKKDGTGLWGVCEDYEQFVPLLVEKLKGTLGGQQLILRAFWAEDDMMIGRGGAEYFDGCFGQEGVEECISYKGKVMKGTNHDNVVDDSEEALESVYQEVKERWSSTMTSMNSFVE